MKQKPDLSFWRLWSLSFGFFGVQIAYALQSANISRIFATLGAVGFALVPIIHDQYLQFVAFLLIGCAWAAMLAMPFTFVTNALQGYGHLGTYLGLFNGTICIPQIFAALCGGAVLSLVGSHQSTMMLVSGVLLAVGAASVTVIKNKFSNMQKIS